MKKEDQIPLTIILIKILDAITIISLPCSYSFDSRLVVIPLACLCIATLFNLYIRQMKHCFLTSILILNLSTKHISLKL